MAGNTLSRYWTLLVCISLLLISTGRGQASEFRSFWADSWNSGFENPTATQNLVNYVKGCNGNAFFLEARKRSDAYYLSTIEPSGTNITPQAGYDSLADAITKAHAAGLQVYAWAVTYRVWDTPSGPPHSTPEHIWYLHPDWFMQNSSGSTLIDGTTTSLDPGHPAVEDYLIGVFMDIVKRYDIDGIALDYIRYPDPSWGYNPTSVARFNAEYGRTGSPSSTDSLWQDWRRDQISNLVKRLNLEVKAVKPQCKVGAATWRTAGSGCSDVLQNWDQWMANGWVDFVSPMNYSPNNTTFHSNNVDDLSHQYSRHVYIATGSYMNTVANNMMQILDVRSTGLTGTAIFSYAAPNSGTADPSGFKNALASGPWSSTAVVPDMPWLTAATSGYVKGFIRDGSGSPIYPATVVMSGTNCSSKNSGTGFYGFSAIAPGTYTLTVSAPGYRTSTGHTTIVAGHVSDVNVQLLSDTVPPVISNVRAENIQGTNAQIRWSTDEPATSQVDYGTAASYGSTTEEDTVPTTDHTVQLVGLTPNTTYHYRVRSYDTIRNVVVSGDYTFKTIGYDNPADIVIDNSDTACVASGSWTTGSSASGRYGANYFWSDTSNASAYCTWTPNIISPGFYDVFCWYSQGSNRSTQGRWGIFYSGGSTEVRVNEQQSGGQWVKIGNRLPFNVGSLGYVRTYAATGDSSSMVAIADAVKFSYVDTSAPTVTIQSPTSGVRYTTTNGILNLSGIASDNVGVTSVGWSNSRGGSGVCTGTSSWSASGIVLQPGANVISVAATDSAGNPGLASLVVVLHSAEGQNVLLSGVTPAGGIVYSGDLKQWKTAPGYLSRVAVGDFDGDGENDIVGLSSDLSIWYTTNESSWTKIPGNLKSMVVGDFNGDGKDDLAGLACNGSIWYTTDLHNWKGVAGTLDSLAAGDFNGDGKEDLVGLSASGSIWYSTNMQTCSQVPGSVTQLCVGDLNGDGADDLVGLSSNGSIWCTTDLQHWTRIPGYLSKLAVGDFNGDGKCDIAGLSSDGSIWYTADESNWSRVPGYLTGLLATDLNADGKGDLAGLSGNGSAWYTTDLHNWSNIPGSLSSLSAPRW